MYPKDSKWSPYNISFMESARNAHIITPRDEYERDSKGAFSVVKTIISTNLLSSIV
jgi:hypothetical protein